MGAERSRTILVHLPWGGRIGLPRAHYLTWFFTILAFIFTLNPAFSQSGTQTEQRIDHWRATLLPDRWPAAADSAAALLAALPPGRYPALRAQALSLRGSALRQGGQLDAALGAHRLALALREKALGPGHEETANSRQNIGNCLLAMGRIAEATGFLQQAADLKERRFGPEHPKLIPVYTALGQCYRAGADGPRAREYLGRALRITEQYSGPRSPLLINALYGLAGVFSDQPEPDSAAELLQRAYRLQLDSVGEQHSTTIALLSALSKASTLSGRPAQGAAFAQQALLLCDRLPGIPAALTGECLLHLGNSLFEIGDYPAAETTLRSALPYSGGQAELEAAVLNSLGLVLRYRGAQPEALEEMTRAVNLFLQSEPSNAARRAAAGALQNLGSCFFDLGDWKAARYYYEQAERQLARVPNSETERAACLDKTGCCLLETNDFAGAERLFQQALRLAPTRQPATLFAIRLHRGDWFFRQKQFAAAAEHYHQALQQLTPAGPVQVLPYPYELLQGNVAVARARHAIATASGKTADWLLAQRTAEDALDVLQTVKPQLQTEASLIELLQIFDTPYDLAVEACLALGQTQRAWQYAEAFKSNFLQRLDGQARRLSAFGLPPALATAEWDFTRQLNRFQKRRNQLVMQPAPDARKIAAIDDSLRRLGDARHRLQQTLAKRYPAYYRWRYAPEQPSLEAVRHCLRPGQSLLSYHWAGDVVYAFILNSDTLLARAIGAPAEATGGSIEQFLDACAQPPGQVPESRRAEAFARLRTLGHRLYLQLVAPVEPFLNQDILIAPDAALCLLPFEALIVSAGAGAHRFDLDTFFLQQHNIGYVHSAAALVELRERPAGGSAGVLAFAPDFSRNRSGLKPLRYNVEEINRVRQVTGAQNRRGTAADKISFANEANGYGVLLLSTHGVLNDRLPSASFVAFTEPADTSDDGLLTVADIYNLDLPVELIVLSACQTASGTLYRGEGMQSIARAFQYAGARGLMASRWNVDDRCMPGLMQRLFEGLWEGQPKSEALTRARRDYLAENKGLDAHPYFWAGLVSQGNDAPLPESMRNPGKWYWWILGIGALILAGWLIKRKRRGSRALLIIV